ncbi:MAG: hypothetical protein H7837_05010 [Magnetococcus sp. MYC-9]
MKELQFLVQESNETPHYTVTIRKNERNLTAHCTCEQGGPDTLCKHRLSILSGKAKWVIGDNGAETKQVLSWVAWTDIGQAITRASHAQKQLRDAERELAKATARLQEAEEAARITRQALIQSMSD